MMARKRSKQRLRVVHTHCAGVDVGSREHWVAVDPDQCQEPVRGFTTFTDDLEALADWLDSLHIKIVAMEATGGSRSVPRLVTDQVYVPETFGDTR